jgi:hypothetical protein
MTAQRAGSRLARAADAQAALDFWETFFAEPVS